MPDFRTLKQGYPKDRDYPARTHHLLALGRVLNGKLYDELQHAFSEEKGDNGEYIPLKARRPSARTGFCRTVVNDSVSLLFSEGHFPSVYCKDAGTRTALATVIKDSKLNAVMIEAATRGSVGSVCIFMRVLKARVFFDVMKTAYLTPTWQKDAPEALESVTERYKLKGSELKAGGYTIAEDDLGAEFWFQRVWDTAAENWYLPQTKADADAGNAPRLDKKRTVRHNLGFVPMVWIKNLPIDGEDDIDGAATFPHAAIDTQIEADYLLSQGGRGLYYQADPTLMIKEPAAGGGATVKGAANAIITGEKGDAKLLEISGDGAKAVMDWIRALREIALEGMGGNRSNADKLSAAQSGRAMELMNQSLIWLADKLRISYGEGALHQLLCMIVRAGAKYSLVDRDGDQIGKMSPGETISLRWPHWYAPTYADKLAQATTLGALRSANLISQETAVRVIAEGYDIENVAEELKQIAKDKPVKPPPSPGSLESEP
jgi:hypothetical protein